MKIIKCLLRNIGKFLSCLEEQQNYVVITIFIVIGSILVQQTYTTYDIFKEVNILNEEITIDSLKTTTSKCNEEYIQYIIPDIESRIKIVCLKKIKNKVFVQFILLSFALIMTTLWLLRTIKKLKNVKSNLERIVKDRTKKLVDAKDELSLLTNDLETVVSDRTKRLKLMIQDLDEFAYYIAHELKSPLRQMNGISSILVKDYLNIYAQDSSEINSYLLNLKELSIDMGIKIESLLRYSRVSTTAINKVNIDLNKIATDILHTKIKENYKDVTIKIHKNLFVNADRLLITSFLTEILNNSWTYLSGECLEIEIGSIAIDDQFVYFVCDNGVGFKENPADIFLLFKKFNSTGLGIGLSLAKKIINHHGGIIWAETSTDTDHGTTIFFTLS